jgi:glucuronoarabinoxylan endo-1,4-beta-xylanase
MQRFLSHIPSRRLIVYLMIICLLMTAAFAMQHRTLAAHAALNITINGATTYQTIDGFGISGAFGPALSLEQLNATDQATILNLLFNTSTGAGFSILRNNLPSDSANTIEPNAPSSPSATPTYTWDKSSQGQVWLAQQAQSFGVKDIYLNAWSAPGFMKTNGSEANGGTLCGVPGASCSSGDWRQAYANYLVQYIKDYESAGITPTRVGFENEPELSTSYSSMLMNAAQSADFIKILSPTLKSAGLSLQIVCCEAEGWNDAQTYTSGIASDSTAFADTGIFSGHGYTGAPTSPLSSAGSKHTWESEWSTFDSWDPAWDSGSDASGFTWANNIYTGLTTVNLSAFFYWAGVWFNSSDNGMLIHDNNGTIAASKRLSAFANYSRFIRPGAVRIGTTSTDGNLNTLAVKNTDGSYDIVVLNASYADTTASFALQNVINANSATPYLTNATNDTAQQFSIPISSGAFSATVPARSLVTYKITSAIAPTLPPTTPTAPTTPTPGGPACKVTYTVSQWNTGFTANITIANTGTTTINGWTLKFAFPTTTQSVTSGWNANWLQSGQNVSATNLSWNASLAAGTSTNIGFNGSSSGSNPSPTSFTLSGLSCASS